MEQVDNFDGLNIYKSSENFRNHKNIALPDRTKDAAQDMLYSQGTCGIQFSQGTVRR